MQELVSSVRGSAHRADVHRLPAARGLDHWIKAFGGAEKVLGLLHVVLLLGLQSCLHELLLPVLQELQLLNRWITHRIHRKKTKQLLFPSPVFLLRPTCR